MTTSRLAQLRQAHGLSLEELAARLGGVVTRQALWKYEHEKARPGPTTVVRLAEALGVRAALLLGEPEVHVRFIAYRKGSGLLKREQGRLQSTVTVALEERERIQTRVGTVTACNVPVQGLAIQAVEDAERAAENLRRLWNLGTDPIASITGVLEDHGVHVIEVRADEKFDGMSAVAEDSCGSVVSAAVVARLGIPGERQRLDLAHELGHLVLELPPQVDEEKAAFRFAAAFLAPQDAIRAAVGSRRRCVQVAELLWLKRRYGMSVHALLRRLRELDIIGESHYRWWYTEIGRLGFRKSEPDPLPAEQPQWLRRTVLRGLAEGILARQDAERALGEAVELDLPLTLAERRAVMRLPLSERRRILEEQADRLAPHYEEDASWRELQAADIVDY